MDASSNLSAPLAGVLTRYRGSTAPDVPKRKPGRPLKRSPDYFRTLLETHRKVEAWFMEARGSRPASDRQLYTEYFADQFQARGERASRAAAPDFQRALKTLRNELAEARRMNRASPGNSVILGTP